MQAYINMGNTVHDLDALVMNATEMYTPRSTTALEDRALPFQRLATRDDVYEMDIIDREAEQTTINGVVRTLVDRAVLAGSIRCVIDNIVDFFGYEQANDVASSMLLNLQNESAKLAAKLDTPSLIEKCVAACHQWVAADPSREGAVVIDGSKDKIYKFPQISFGKSQKTLSIYRAAMHGKMPGEQRLALKARELLREMELAYQLMVKDMDAITAVRERERNIVLEEGKARGQNLEDLFEKFYKEDTESRNELSSRWSNVFTNLTLYLTAVVEAMKTPGEGVMRVRDINGVVGDFVDSTKQCSVDWNPSSRHYEYTPNSRIYCCTMFNAVPRGYTVNGGIRAPILRDGVKFVSDEERQYMEARVAALFDIQVDKDGAPDNLSLTTYKSQVIAPIAKGGLKTT
jgi:hypothetical protein